MMPEQEKNSEEVLNLLQITGLKFSHIQKMYGVYEEKGIDHLIQLKFKTNQAGFDEFIRENHLDISKFSNLQRALLLPDSDWWDPSKIDLLPTIQISRIEGQTINVGYSRKSEDVVDLYIRWFTT